MDQLKNEVRKETQEGLRTLRVKSRHVRKGKAFDDWKKEGSQDSQIQQFQLICYHNWGRGEEILHDMGAKINCCLTWAKETFFSIFFSALYIHTV